VVVVYGVWVKVNRWREIYTHYEGQRHGVTPRLARATAPRARATTLARAERSFFIASSRLVSSRLAAALARVAGSATHRRARRIPRRTPRDAHVDAADVRDMPHGARDGR